MFFFLSLYQVWCLSEHFVKWYCVHSKRPFCTIKCHCKWWWKLSYHVPRLFRDSNCCNPACNSVQCLLFQTLTVYNSITSVEYPFNLHGNPKPHFASSLSPGLPGSGRPSTVLHAERLAGPSAHWCVLQHQPLQATESLLLLVKPLYSLVSLPPCGHMLIGLHTVHTAQATGGISEKLC